MTTPCMLCDSQSVYKALSEHLGIGFGGRTIFQLLLSNRNLNWLFFKIFKFIETTKDGLFTMLELECLGACANAPMMSVGDVYYVWIELN